jgi:hypothetical protein
MSLCVLRWANRMWLRTVDPTSFPGSHLRYVAERSFRDDAAGPAIIACVIIKSDILPAENISPTFSGQRTEGRSGGAAPMPVNWKDDVTLSDLLPACTINALFSTMALFDYSVASWANELPPSRLSLIVNYLQWKAELPVIRMVLFPLLLVFPVVLIAIYYSLLQTLFGWRKATAVRHAMDVVEAMGISTIIYVAAARVKPAEEAVLGLCAAAKMNKKEESACIDAASTLPPLYLAIVLLNVVMLFAPIIKFRRGNIKPKVV